MSRRQIWWSAGVALMAVWIVAGIGFWLADSKTPTAEKTMAFMAEHSLESRQPNERMHQIEKLGAQINRLSFEERHKLLFDPRQRTFYKEMTDAEKARYLDLTIAKGMRQMMEAFDKMLPERRAQLLEQALTRLDNLQGGSREQLRQRFSEPFFERAVREGLASYFHNASAATKLELQPLLEQIQRLVQTAR